MASASVRLLTQGWSGDQRRALMTVLDDRQVQMVRDRIHIELSENRIERVEADDAVQFLSTRGAPGTSSWGIPEWACAVLFGNDPSFRAAWQAIRRGDAPPESET